MKTRVSTSRLSAVILLLASLLASSVLTGCSSVRPVKRGRVGLLEKFGIEDRRASRTGGVTDRNMGREEREPAYHASADAEPDLAPVKLSRLRRLGLRWPLKDVQVTSPFGARNRDQHEGIDLRAKRGTTVYASHGGTVLYADDRIRGYGKMIVLKHPAGVATVYAHNSKLLVRRGSRVKAGQKIAVSGNTGRSTGPHLHFEVRDGSMAVDPYLVLAKPQIPAVRTAEAATTKTRSVATR